MKKAFLLAAFAFTFSVLLYAQKVSGVVKGILKDSASGQSLNNASVSVITQKDSTLISFTLTSNNGYFETCTRGYSQKATVDTSRSCLQVANELSYYWKLDSLANNGFRLYTYKKFLVFKPDKI